MKRFFIALISIILLAILIIFAFYTIPLNKANSLLISANKTPLTSIIDETFISQENYEKLNIINRPIHENEYVQLKTNKKFRFINLKNIELVCFVKATIDSYDENVLLDTYTKKLTISFSFKNNSWLVSSVKTESSNQQQSGDD